MATETCDIVVIGGGAAGLACALFAARAGARVVLLERMAHLGGTSALSAGSAWVPGTRFAAEGDSVERALAYLDAAVGNAAPREMRRAFLAAGPEAIAELEAAGIPFRARPFHPDYLSELEGSATGGRALEVPPFDGTVLGPALRLIRPPIPEFTVLGGMQVDRDDIRHLLGMGRSPRSALHGLRLVARYAVERVRHGRAARLVMGQALTGRLLHAALAAGVEIRTEARVTGMEPGRAVRLEDGAEIGCAAIVLATGGFNRGVARRAEMVGRPAEHCPGAPGHTGALHDLALAAGARYGENGRSHVFWAPVSLRTRADGSHAAFPHFVMDRSKPGTLAVGADGRRFTNEARSYHEFALAQIAAGAEPAWLVTDAAGLRAYGLGMVRPGERGAARLEREGYLHTGETPEALAGRIHVDPSGLAHTIERMNRFAATGVDEDFRRGETVYERANGDAAHGPNPTLGRLDTPPFHAVALWPGDIGAATGLLTDAAARVLGPEDTPLPGLWAIGADMHSVMGGVYPGPGITLGPALAFARLAAKGAVQRALGRSE